MAEFRITAVLILVFTACMFCVLARCIFKLMAAKNKQDVFLDLLLKNSQDYILIFDELGRLVDCTDAFLSLAKNRNGPTNEVRLIFKREITRFFNATAGYYR